MAICASVCAVISLLQPAHADPDLLDASAPSFNFYGVAGLLEMPTADLNRDGEMSITTSFTPTMDRYNLGFTALPWLETTFRYARIDRYGIATTIGGDLYDRSLGFKIRLSKEDDIWPTISVGAQDILGTGAFGAEYLVASKHIGDFELTGGIGWRRFGGTATFSNPIGLILPSFKQNPTFQGTGTPLLNQFFHGKDAGLIGGISWQTPIDGLTLIAELSGDPYTVETRAGSINEKSRINFGFSYQPIDGMQIGGGWLYGTQFGVRVSFFTNAFDSSNAPRLGTAPTPMVVRTEEARNRAEQAALQDATQFYTDWPGGHLRQGRVRGGDLALADALFGGSASHKLNVRDVEGYGDSLIVDIRNANGAATCAQAAAFFDAASASGYQQIVFSTSGDPSDVKICAVTPRLSPNSSVGMQFADLTTVSDQQPTSPDEDPNALPPAAPALSNDELRRKIVDEADAQSISVDGFLIHDGRIDIAYSNSTYRTETEAIGRLVRILMANAPDNVVDFRFVSLSGYTPQRAVLLHRADIERIYNLDGSATELLPVSDIVPIADDDPVVEKGNLVDFPAFTWGISPGYQQSLFDPDQPYRFGIYVGANAGVALSPHLLIGGGVEANVFNNFNSITRASNSVLPHVRSDFALYLKDGKNSITSLTAQYITKLSPEVYFLGKAGYLESMYGGFGGEIFWQPSHQRFSFGGALYAVQQRAFDGLFGFRDYKVITGHVSAYYESPYHGLNFELHVGRYLAGDYGATFQVTRRFDSGVEIGVYATLTNVPFSKFGEGSFDKGFIIHIPVDFLAPLNSQDEVRFDFSPLTRDGGQRLDGEETLFYATRAGSESELLPTWDQVLHP